jgi:hypothetical protein
MSLCQPAKDLLDSEGEGLGKEGDGEAIARIFKCCKGAIGKIDKHNMNLDFLFSIREHRCIDCDVNCARIQSGESASVL